VPVTIRRRAEADLDELVRIAQVVQALDGYPGRQPRDMTAFLAAPYALSAWVAELDGAVVGHVALHRESLPVVMERAASVLDCEPSQLAVVARLLVDPAVRRAGIGRALLDAAAVDARSRGLHPILDVVTHFEAANALYRSCGWHNAGEVTMVFRDGTSLQSFVYLAPG
jgi:GNAT superfamily N-acetyltransferase